MKIALVLAVVASLLQLVTGHSSAEGVAEHQPAKLAAMEAHYPAEGPGDLWLFGWVDEDAETVRMGVKLPGMLSWLVHGDTAAPVTGLRAFAPRGPAAGQCRLPVLPPDGGHRHGADRSLAWPGCSFCGAAGCSRRAGCCWVFVFAVLGPQLANQMGWMTAEVGRQPWIV